MPLGFLAGKSKSSSQWILTVQLPDESRITIPLSFDVIGKDCRERIASKIGVEETKYFGLRFLTRKQSYYRWISQEKSVQRQLLKRGAEPLESAVVEFGVQFYETNIALLRRELTRHMFYLELRQRVLDSHLECSLPTAFALAGYSLQAELGDYSPETSSSMFPPDAALIPQGLLKDVDPSELQSKVISAHKSYAGISPAAAEYAYVLTCMQLEFYGVEFFPAYERDNKPIQLGVSVNGIKLRANQGTTAHSWRWIDVEAVKFQRNNFVIEVLKPKDTVSFDMKSFEMSKYCWYVFMAQHLFFRWHSQTTAGGLSSTSSQSSSSSSKVLLGSDLDVKLRALSMNDETRNRFQKERASSNSFNNAVVSQKYQITGRGSVPSSFKMSLKVDVREAAIQKLTELLQNDSLDEEFKSIFLVKMKSDVKTASLVSNCHRNRYPDVLPYEENRVMLKPDEERKTNYINASHIKYQVSPSMDLHCIIAQNPLEETRPEFWKMIWEQQVSLIIMLGDTQDGGLSVSASYWPDDYQIKELRIAQLVVSSKNVVRLPNYVTRHLAVKHRLSPQVRQVVQLQYLDWNDDCPVDQEDFLEFISEVDSYRTMLSSLNHPAATGRAHETDPPTESGTPATAAAWPSFLVHCRDGAGRSGLFVMSYILVHQLEQNQPVDPGIVLARLRTQRMRLVESSEQYRSIHQLLLRNIKSDRLI